MKPTPLLTLLLSAPLALAAQVAPNSAATPPAAAAAPARLDPASAPAAPKEVVTLSPFTVNTDRDNGFMAANAGTATRLSLDMADVPAPYSVMTRDFIDALGLTSVQEATMWAVNGGPVPDGNGADTFGISTIVQVRGVILANGGSSGGSATTRNNYLSNAIQDSYSMERYEFGRGPNAALFSIGANSPLGGSLGSSSKVARYDRSFETIETKFGSWNYQRATLDVNRPLTRKAALRGNFVWMDRDGWKRRETEQVKGATVTGSYLLTPKTEIRIEATAEKFARSIPQIVFSENLTGWDGFTTIRGPVTNSIYSTTATPGVTSVAGVSQLFGPGGLTLSGTTQGVDRRAGGYYVWDPSQGMIMNFQNEALTRRGDDTATTPLLGNGVLWVRGTAPGGYPFGNAASQTTTPTPTTIGGSLNFLYQTNLPADRFNRALGGSRFRLPDKRDNDTTDAPIFQEHHKDLNVTLTHQIGERWFFELGADGSNLKDRRQNVNDFQTVRIDINQALPNGAPNPHFLTPYADGTEEWRYVAIKNRSLRYNVAYKANLGRWGDYILNLNGSLSTRDTLQLFYQYSLHRGADARLWTQTDNLIRVRHYWYESGRPFGDDGVPGQVFRRDFAADNNSFTTATEAVTPSWVLSSWNDNKQTFFNNGLAMSAKYFGGKLVLLAAGRRDDAKTHVKNSVISSQRGYLPANWDGVTPLWLPDAPADYAALTYIPRSAAGAPLSTIPVAANTRPTIATPVPAGLTANAGNVADPLYAGDRFRNDYSPPTNNKHPMSISTGGVWSPLHWLSLVANYATSYQLPPAGRFTLDGQLADVQVGSGYDLGTRFRFFNGQLQVNAGYYFNKQRRVQATPPTSGPINSLYGRNAYTDPLTGSRNNLGLPDIIGTDYASQRNNGYELDLVASFRSGLRLTWNVGSGQLLALDRFPLAKVYVAQHADDFRRVLEAAGGRLDTTQRNPTAPHAPGLAVLDPARPNAGAGQPAEQTGAVADYNNLWAQYEAILTDAPTIGVRKIVSNAYADYAFQSGFLRGVRAGLGVQYRGDNISGYRTADTTTTLVNGVPQLQYGPTAGLLYPIYTRQPLNTVGTLAYTTRLKGTWWGKSLEGKPVTLQLNVNNLLNRQRVIYQDDTVVPRAPNGDFSQANRVSVPAKNAIYQQPISAIVTMRLAL